jgi:hypothetical protein
MWPTGWEPLIYTDNLFNWLFLEIQFIGFQINITNVLLMKIFEIIWDPILKCWWLILKIKPNLFLTEFKEFYWLK